MAHLLIVPHTYTSACDLVLGIALQSQGPDGFHIALLRIANGFLQGRDEFTGWIISQPQLRLAVGIGFLAELVPSADNVLLTLYGTVLTFAMTLRIERIGEVTIGQFAILHQ